MEEMRRMKRHKIAMVTAGEERFPAGTVEAIREFAEIRCRRCETPEELLREFGDCESSKGQTLMVGFGWWGYAEIMV